MLGLLCSILGGGGVIELYGGGWVLCIINGSAAGGYLVECFRWCCGLGWVSVLLFFLSFVGAGVCAGVGWDWL